MKTLYAKLLEVQQEIDGIKITDARIRVQETLQTNEVY